MDVRNGMEGEMELWKWQKEVLRDGGRYERVAKVEERWKQLVGGEGEGEGESCPSQQLESKEQISKSDMGHNLRTFLIRIIYRMRIILLFSTML